MFPRASSRIAIRSVLPALPLALAALLGSCGEEGDSTNGPGSGHSAIVRFEMTADTGSPFAIADVPMVYHSVESIGSCNAVLYDAEDDTVWGTDSFARFQIWDAVCYPIFDAGINGYSFLGEVNVAIVQATSLSDLSAEQIPFALGFYSRADDPSVTGTFEFWVDEVNIP